MEAQRGFNTEDEKRHIDSLVNAMHNGLVFAENGIRAGSDVDAITRMTCSLLLDGVEPRYKSGGFVFEKATEIFLNTDRRRIKKLLNKVRCNRNNFEIKTSHCYSRRNNTDMV